MSSPWQTPPAVSGYPHNTKLLLLYCTPLYSTPCSLPGAAATAAIASTTISVRLSNRQRLGQLHVTLQTMDLLAVVQLSLGMRPHL
jgi:hypothetical protein